MKFENKKEFSHLIIGAGEVGKSLFGVLKKRYSVAIRDKSESPGGNFEVLHIAYPNSKNFVDITKNYIKKYNPKLVVIHSTVPVGTTRKIASFAVHSPVRGVHPGLEKGIKTFVKYFGGRDAGKAAAYFAKLGIKTQIFKKPETTELLKILDTTYYAWNVVFCKETKRICDGLGLDFDEVYTIANADYNEGYKKLKMPQVVRPVLKHVKGKIGGHCLIPNCDLLKDWLTEIIKKRNLLY